MEKRPAKRQRAGPARDRPSEHYQCEFPLVRLRHGRVYLGGTEERRAEGIFATIPYKPIRKRNRSFYTESLFSVDHEIVAEGKTVPFRGEQLG